MQRILLFILISLASIWIGFTWMGDVEFHKVVIFLGYPNLLVAFSLFIVAMLRLQVRDRFWQAISPKRWTAYLAIGLVSAMMLMMEPMGFQIVFDEVILAVSGQLMHFQRLAGVPQEANDYFGSYNLFEVMLDKRPFFFPFLLSLIHDLTGYRYQNAFFLNGILTVVLFLLVYLTGKGFSGHRGGLLAVLLGGTLPMISIFATSGHFEILNLVMVCLVLLLGMNYMRSPAEHRLVPLVLALVLLAQVRYENCLYLLPFGILILLGWAKTKRVILPWQVLISPAFLIMNVIQYRMMKKSEHGFFQEGPNGRTDTFSLSYVTENAVAAKNFFFSIGSAAPNSYLLTVFGIASVMGFGYLIFRKNTFSNWRNPRTITACALVISIVLFTAVVGCFNYGLFDRHITSRLSLPIYLLFMLLPSYVMRRMGRGFLILLLLTGLVAVTFSVSGFDRKDLLVRGVMMIPLVVCYVAALYWIWKWAPNPRLSILAVPVIFILTTTIPIGHAHRYSQDYISNDILLAELRFIKQRKEHERMLFISESMYSAMLTEINGTYISKLKDNPETAKEHLKRNMYASIYVARNYERLKQGQFQLSKEKHSLDSNIFILETIDEVHLGPNQMIKFERLLDVRLEPGHSN